MELSVRADIEGNGSVKLVIVRRVKLYDNNKQYRSADMEHPSNYELPVQHILSTSRPLLYRSSLLRLDNSNPRLN